MPPTVIQGCRIVGICTTVPEAKVTVADHAKIFGQQVAESVAKNCGVQERRVSPPGVCTSDLCYDAADRLIRQLDWDRNSIDAVIFVSQSPDFALPATACVLQHRLGLSQACGAFDVNQGCSGYIYGLWLASQMISSQACKRVLLLAGDVPTKMIDKSDQSTGMLFGDAGTATVLESDETAPDLTFVIGTDGSGAEHLIMRHKTWDIVGNGNSTTTSNSDVVQLRQQCTDSLFMDGAEIFSFTLGKVPKVVKQIVTDAGWTLDTMDYLLMHQANKFILDNIARRLKIPDDKYPLSLDRYGNTSSASIPITIASELSGPMTGQSLNLVLVGFGVGLSWGAVAWQSDRLAVCDLQELSTDVDRLSQAS